MSGNDNITHISDLIKKRSEMDLLDTDKLSDLPSDTDMKSFLSVMSYIMGLTTSHSGAINIGEGKMTIQLDHHMPNEEHGIEDLYVCQSTSKYDPAKQISQADVDTLKELLRSMMI